MKLRFIKNYIWYDGPQLNLYMNEENLDLYLGCVMPVNGNDYDTIWMVRQIDHTVSITDDDVNYPNDFWKADEDFWKFDRTECKVEREYGFTLEFAFEEAIPFTKEDIEKVNGN